MGGQVIRQEVVGAVCVSLVVKLPGMPEVRSSNCTTAIPLLPPPLLYLPGCSLNSWGHIERQWCIENGPGGGYAYPCDLVIKLICASQWTFYNCVLFKAVRKLLSLHHFCARSLLHMAGLR